MTAFVDVIRPIESKPLGYAYDCLCLILGSFFLAALSQLAIPLWFSPVPLTMQTFAVLLIGALLGSKRGSLAVVLYLIEGATGLPFFAGGTSGISGVTAGYLLGFVVCAFLVGFLLEKGWRESYKGTLLALILGSLAILLSGFLWLSLYVGPSTAFAIGVYPFLIGDAVKLVAATAIIASGWKLIPR